MLILHIDFLRLKEMFLHVGAEGVIHGKMVLLDAGRLVGRYIQQDVGHFPQFAAGTSRHGDGSSPQRLGHIKSVGHIGGVAGGGEPDDHIPLFAEAGQLLGIHEVGAQVVDDGRLGRGEADERYSAQSLLQTAGDIGAGLLIDTLCNVGGQGTFF